MNYYPFHIGDYASATRHLSWDEDAAYRRLLDAYYTLEKPIGADRVYRLVLAASKAQRQAVDVVLSEFFTLTSDGWMHERCESELDSMRVKQAAQEDKDRHETDRMRRYRERRAAMFEALRAVEIVPAWDVPMKELQRLFDTNCNAPATTPATHLQREQAVAGVTPATAIPTPTPTPAKDSVPSGTGGKPPMSTEEIIFGYGVPLLVSAGSTDKAARSFLGGLRKGHGDGPLIDSLRNCLREKPLQPLEWLAAALPPGGQSAKPGKHSGFEKLNYREGVAADGSIA